MHQIKKLEPHHKEIIRMVAAGMTNKEIATITKFADSSIETVRGKLIRYAGVRNSPQLVAWAYESGILKLQHEAA
jgi:DNA-binding CsgD family transcriptional regulator